MGKKDFHKIYLGAKKERGPQLGIKLSFFSDLYNPSSSYAGLIIYHKDDRHEWVQLTDKTRGGFKGKSFYVMIQDTTRWDPREFKRAGEGKVHDALFQRLCGEDFRNNTACCGGFAVIRGQVRVSSIWLNMTTRTLAGQRNRWESDGRKELSDGERALVYKAVAHWATHFHERKVMRMMAEPVPLGREGCLVEQAILHGTSSPAGAAPPEASKYSMAPASVPVAAAVPLQVPPMAAPMGASVPGYAPPPPPPPPHALAMPMPQPPGPYAPPAVAYASAPPYFVGEMSYPAGGGMYSCVDAKGGCSAAGSKENWALALLEEEMRGALALHGPPPPEPPPQRAQQQAAAQQSCCVIS